MQFAIHLLSIVLMCAVFQLGGMISRRSEEWSLAIEPDAHQSAGLRKSFFLSGKFVQVAAVIWALMNFMAIMHPVSGL